LKLLILLRFVAGFGLSFSLLGCQPTTEQTPIAPTPALADSVPTMDAVLVTPIPTLSPYPWVDASTVMNGICFESAFDAAGRTFVIRTSEEHIAFYDAADSSQLCRRPVVRNPFDFSNGQILAGGWSKGRGCTAQHEVLGFQREDENRRLALEVRFVTEGDCNYELVRAFWIGIADMPGYEIVIAFN
jgi:hypothetical protein